MSDYQDLKILSLDEQCNRLNEKNDLLEEKIKILKDALEFYANENSWYLHKDFKTGCEVRRSIELKDTESFGYIDDQGNNILKVNAGKIARQALKKIEEMSK